MSESTQKLLQSIDNRLKWLLMLEVENQFDGDATNKEKIKLLHKMGFKTSEMAEIIGTTPASIRSTRSDLRDEGVLE